jgi:hypothetical protein
MPKDRIVAVALLSRSDLATFGSDLRKVYPVEDTPAFSDLLTALDKADREQWREEERLAALERLRIGR